jgi:hypothetical protein
MTKDMTIEQFCTKHKACKEGKKWASAYCASMEGVWRKAKPAWLLWVATRPSVLTDKELRLFAVFAARQVQHLMTDSRSIAAIDVAERFANGEASVEELETAYAVARAVARAAAYTAAYATTSAARAAARVATSAARAATWATSNAAMKESQATWLRENTTPNFL